MKPNYKLLHNIIHMTDRPEDKSPRGNVFLGRLLKLDSLTLGHIEKDPQLADELMQHPLSSRSIVDIAVMALLTDPNFASRFRRIFKLNFVTLVSINPQIGKELEKVAWHMFENDIEGISQLLKDWNVPSVTMKYFALEYFFQSKKVPDPVIWAKVMNATGLSGNDIQGHCEVQLEKAIRDGQRSKTGLSAKAAAGVSSDPVVTPEDDRVTAPTAEA